MKRLPMIGVFALLIGAFVPSLVAQESIEGDWVGGSNLFGSPVFVHARFTPTPSGFSGLTNIQLWKVSNRPFSVVKVETSQVHLELPFGVATFIGRVWKDSQKRAADNDRSVKKPLNLET